MCTEINGAVIPNPQPTTKTGTVELNSDLLKLSHAKSIRTKQDNETKKGTTTNTVSLKSTTKGEVDHFKLCDGSPKKNSSREELNKIST